MLAQKQRLLLQPLQGISSPLPHITGDDKSVFDSLSNAGDGNAGDGNGNKADPGSRSVSESNPGAKREKGLHPVGKPGLTSNAQDRKVDDSNPEGVESRPRGHTPGLVQLQDVQRKVEKEGGGQVVRRASDHSRPVPHQSESVAGSQNGRSQIKGSNTFSTHDAAKSSPVPSCDQRDVVMTTEQERTSSEQRSNDSTPPLSPRPCPLVHPIPSPTSDAGLRVEERMKKLDAKVSRASTDIKTADASTMKESVKGSGAEDEGPVKLPQGARGVQQNIEDRGGDTSSSKRASHGDAVCSGGTAKALPKFEPHSSSVLSMKVSSVWVCVYSSTCLHYTVPSMIARI